MPLPEPVPGAVIRYSYLWSEERAKGREEGVKWRPCVIIVAVTHERGRTRVSVAPITHRPPPKANRAVEISAAEKKRLGLDEDRSWVVTDEMNSFTWPGPDVQPVAYGLVSRALYYDIRDAIVENGRDKKLKIAPR